MNKIDYSNKELRRDIIVERYDNPKNKVEDITVLKEYKKTNSNSPSCIDNFNIAIKIKNNIIKDIKYSGIGCAISTASTDLIIDKLKNKKVSDALTYIDNYFKMIDNKKHDKKELGEMVIFDNIYKQLNRVKCAKIGIEGIAKLLNE